MIAQVNIPGVMMFLSLAASSLGAPTPQFEFIDLLGLTECK